MTELGAAAAAALERIRSERPLVHHLSSPVVLNDTANATLALGGLPVMAQSISEIAAVTGAADAVVLNLGMLDPDRTAAMGAALAVAARRALPVVLDPAGSATMPTRLTIAQEFLNRAGVTHVRGNLAEVGALAGNPLPARGVDAVEEPDSFASLGQRSGLALLASVAELARTSGTVVAATGARDWISDGTLHVAVDNGHPLLTRVTGAGCMATTVVALFAAVTDDPLAAAAAGLACFGVAAAHSAETAAGPGSLRTGILDALYRLTPRELEREALLLFPEFAAGDEPESPPPAPRGP